MKKNILKLALLIFMLFPSITSHALTTLAFKESSNGVIDTTIHFEEGFVGGIDVVYKISDTVKVKNFEFNKEFTTKKYTKTYSYDAVNHTLRIIVTTGGVGAEHNLLNEKKELSLGKIEFETTSKKSVDYNISYIALSYNDNNWKNVKLEDSNVTLGDTSKFTYVVKVEEKPNDEEKEPPKEEDNDKDNNDDKDKEEEDKPTTGGESSGNESESSGNESGNQGSQSGNTSGSTGDQGSTTTKPEENPTEDNKPTTPSTDNDEDQEDIENNNQSSNNSSSSSNQNNNSSTTKPNVGTNSGSNQGTSGSTNKTEVETSNGETTDKTDTPQLEDDTILDGGDLNQDDITDEDQQDNEANTEAEEDTKSNKVLMIASVVAILIVVGILIIVYIKSTTKKTIDF